MDGDTVTYQVYEIFISFIKLIKMQTNKCLPLYRQMGGNMI